MSNVPWMYHTVIFFSYSFKCTVSSYNSEPAFSASSLCQELSSAHDRIAKNLCYIIIYATQIRSSNMNSLAVTFVNNSLVNLWMTNTRSWKPTKTLVGGREITSKKTQKGTENSSIFQVKLGCKQVSWYTVLLVMTTFSLLPRWASRNGRLLRKHLQWCRGPQEMFNVTPIKSPPSGHQRPGLWTLILEGRGVGDENHLWD